MPAYVVLVTAPAGEKAAALAKALVERKLAACVNRVPGVESTYWWEGKLAVDAEDLLVIKTDKTRFKELQKAVKALHPYKVPELLALRVKEGSRDYLAWLLDTVRAPRKKVRIPKGKP